LVFNLRIGIHLKIKEIMKLFKKIQLIGFAIITIIIALSYGVIPKVSMETIYGITYTGDLSYMMRTLSGLLISLSIFWIYTAITENFKWGLLVQIFYEVGLIAGRTISIIVDGVPQNFMLYSFLFAEIAVLIVVLYLFNNEAKIKTSPKLEYSL